ncbi:MAG TPA: rhodanese-like domain-containing protein [Mycobacteriales bacterium]|jgi:rhodanese-related sulfurtransferase|nr:rhodanese-like domain-containing protein [Mycobacteriales bacterium]
MKIRSSVNAVPPAPPAEATHHFAARLAFETDPADLFNDLHHEVGDVVVVDVRSAAAYAEGHLPGARHLPWRRIDEETTLSLDRGATYVTYCDGPGCNASTKGALALARLGFAVKELIGGIEYWRREGHPTERGGHVANV